MRQNIQQDKRSGGAACCQPPSALGTVTTSTICLNPEHLRRTGIIIGSQRARWQLVHVGRANERALSSRVLMSRHEAKSPPSVSQRYANVRHLLLTSLPFQQCIVYSPWQRFCGWPPPPCPLLWAVPPGSFRGI